MSRYFKRIGTVLLAVVLTFSSASVLASAETLPSICLTDTQKTELFEEINAGISDLTKSVPSRNAPAETKEKQAEKLLNAYQSQGLVKDVVFREESGLYEFTYFNGYLGAVETRSHDPLYNGASNDPLDGQYYDIEESISQNVPERISDSIVPAKALILFAFDQEWDDSNARKPFYKSLEKKWENKGLETDINWSVKVSDIKNIHYSYNVICFSCHGCMYGDQPLMALSEKTTSYNLAAYKKDLSAGRIVLLNGEVYGILPSLISGTYRDGSFANKFIFSESCEFLGKDQSLNYTFANAFVSKGAAAVYGFNNSVNMIFARKSMECWINQLLAGKTAKEAFTQTTKKYGTDWWPTSGRELYRFAYPNWKGSANAKLVGDTEKPSGLIVYSTTDVAPAQTVLLHLHDDIGIAGYYWGRSALYSNNAFYATSSSNADRDILLKGTYYLTVKDRYGKLSDTVNITYHTITLDASGGSVSLRTVLMREDYSFQLPTPTYPGYTFDYWQTEPDGGTRYYSRILADEDQTLYAHWSLKKLVVIFDVNGGETCSIASKSVTYTDVYGELPVTTRRGYIHTGWYTDAVGGTEITENTPVTNRNDHSIYAHWTAKCFTVTFDANEGAGAPVDTIVTYGAAYGALPSAAEVTRAGYTFCGWYTTPDDGIPITANSVVRQLQDHTLYAHWNPAVLYGDASGDGEVDLRDAACIARYLAGGWNIILDEAAADINGDGKVNLRDVAVLRKNLAGS